MVNDVRHVLTLFDDRVGWVALALTLVGAVVAVSTRRRTGRAGWVFAAWTSGVLIVSVTLVNRGVLRSDDGWSSDLTWWARHWSDLPAAVTSDLGWWSNLVLFVPAGAVGCWLWGRLLRIVAGLAAVSFAIETLHATVLSGAADPADLVANTAGAALGVMTVSSLRWARSVP